MTVSASQCFCVCVFRLVEELWSGAVRPGLGVSVPEVGLCHGAVQQEDDVPGLGLRMLQGAVPPASHVGRGLVP